MSLTNTSGIVTDFVSGTIDTATSLTNDQIATAKAALSDLLSTDGKLFDIQVPTSPPTKYTAMEPQSKATDTSPPKYPYNHVTATESGHLFEMDDTPGRERVRLTHRTGTFSEMHPDGTQVNHIFGEGYEIVEKDKKVIIKGSCIVSIEGDAVMDVKGDFVHRVKGNYYQEVKGDYNLLVSGQMSTIAGKDISISTGSTTGTIWLTAPGYVDIHSDLEVDGQISGESIMSRNEVTAGTGIHAGLPGSLNPIAGISTLGGISAGAPMSVGPGIISSTVSVLSPLVYGYGAVMDSRGPMEMIRLLYDMHVHPCPEGTTGTPVPLM